MLEDIRDALAPVSEALTSPGYLRRGGTVAVVRMNPHSSVRPARAGQSGRSYDAKFRFHNGPTKPMQNDEVSMDGLAWWRVWRVIPSPLETHSFLECMAPPSDIVLPLIKTKVPDGLGGFTVVEAPQPDQAFVGKLSHASTERMLTAQTEGEMNRAALGYWVSEVTLVPGTRLTVRGESFAVIAVSTDDENPNWGQAILAREE